MRHLSVLLVLCLLLPSLASAKSKKVKLAEVDAILAELNDENGNFVGEACVEITGRALAILPKDPDAIGWRGFCTYGMGMMNVMMKAMLGSPTDQDWAELKTAMVSGLKDLQVAAKKARNQELRTEMAGMIASLGEEPMDPAEGCPRDPNEYMLIKVQLEAMTEAGLTAPAFACEKPSAPTAEELAEETPQLLELVAADSAEAYMELSNDAMANGQVAAGLAYAESALEMDPEHAAARGYVGYCRYLKSTNYMVDYMMTALVDLEKGETILQEMKAELDEAIPDIAYGAKHAKDEVYKDNLQGVLDILRIPLEIDDSPASRRFAETQAQAVEDAGLPRPEIVVKKSAE